MNPKSTEQILDALAADFIPEDINLLPGIAARYGQKSVLQALRARPALMILFVVLALTLLTGVAYAIGRSLGFIPGVGLVDQARGLLILETPGSVKRDGITITVKQVAADATRTWLTYRVEGIPALVPGSGHPICIETPSLRLSDGKTLGSTGGGNLSLGTEYGRPMSFETSLTFPPLPAHSQEVTFLSPCQMPSIELALVPAPADFATPAMELGATFEASAPQFSSTPPPTLRAQTAIPTPKMSPTPHSVAVPTVVLNGSGLRLEQVFETGDSYLLIGNFRDGGDLPGRLVINSSSNYEYQLHIEDGKGQPIPFQLSTELLSDVYRDGLFPWAYAIPKPVAGPLTLRLDQVKIETADTTQFQLDAGPDPQVGQRWTLNLPFQVGGYEFVLDRAERVLAGYVFYWHSGLEVPDGLQMTLALPGFPPSTGDFFASTFRQRDQVAYLQSFLIEEPIATGHLTFELTLRQTVPLPGPWTLQWMPPGP